MIDPDVKLPSYITNQRLNSQMLWFTLMQALSPQRVAPTLLPYFLPVLNTENCLAFRASFKALFLSLNSTLFWRRYDTLGPLSCNKVLSRAADMDFDTASTVIHRFLIICHCFRLTTCPMLIISLL